MQYFLWFLAIVLTAELFATYLIEIVHIKTYTLNNLLNAFILFFYALFYIQSVNDKIARFSIFSLLFIFTIWWLYDNLSFGTFYRYNYLHFVLAAAIQMVFVLIFFHQYLNTDTITNHNVYECQLIVSMGVLLYNLGVILVFAFAKSINDSHIQLWGQRLNFQIPRLLCIPLYTCIAIALLKWKPLQHHTSYTN